MSSNRSSVNNDESITVIDALNDKPKIFIFHTDLVAPFAIIISITFVVCYIVLGLSITFFVAVTVWLCSAWWILAGNKSYRFTDRLFPLPGKGYFNLNTLFVPATEAGSFRRKINTKINPQMGKTSKGKFEKIVPFQIESNLHAIMEINFGEDNFGLLLKCDKNYNWSATIPFALEGIHPQLSDTQVSEYTRSLSDALKDIPFGESLTLRLGCRSNFRRRLKTLERLSKINKLPLIELLLESERLRVQEITQKGFRQEWEQYALVSWTQNKQSLRKNNDLLSKFMNSVGKSFSSKSRAFAGTEDAELCDIYVKLAREIYENSFIPWKMTLGTKAKLNCTPLNPQQVWEDLLWYRFNQTEAPPIPQLIKVEKIGREYNSQIKVLNTLHPKDTISVLLEGERGQATCPQHHGRRDIIAVNNQLVATMVLEKPPEKWSNPREQLNWLWSKIGDVSVFDTEVFLEINNADKNQAHDRLIKISKQSTFSNVHAIKEGEGIDVAATLRQSEAIEAQRRLHLGGEPLYAAMTILVYRKNLEQLERACNRLSNSFSPAKLIRDEKICWKLWNETLPNNNQHQLQSTAIFSERRSILDSFSMLGLLPLEKPKNLHPDGLELINEEGGYPIYIDLFKRNERAIITGKSGSGKSVLSFGIIKHALALGIKVIGIDMSNAGDSTFQLVTNLLGDKGAYINIATCSFNLLQPPDLRGFPLKKRTNRLKIWKNFLTTILVSLAMGQIDDPELRGRIDAIILMLLKTFLSDSIIVERYNKAFEHGWQSSYWQNMPVLKDLLFFCSKEKLGLQNYSSVDERAIAQINNQIGAKLADPNIGAAISQPSNIPPLPDMTFFALSGLTNENNAYIMALVAQMACLNVALENPKSLFVMDECSVLLAKRGFSEIVGERFATGRKEGQSVLLIGQDFEAISNCPFKSQILTNSDYKIIGKTTSEALQTYVELTKIPFEILARNASQSFETNTQYYFSHWLVCRDDIYWICLYYPTLMDLAALANSADEKAARNLILSKYPKSNLGILEALSVYSQQLSCGGAK